MLDAACNTTHAAVYRRIAALKKNGPTPISISLSRLLFNDSNSVSSNEAMQPHPLLSP